MQVRAISPAVVEHSSRGFGLVASVTRELLAPVDYGCLIYDGQQEQVAEIKADVVGRLQLECHVPGSLGPGAYSVGLTASPQVEPLGLSGVYVLRAPQLSHLSPAGALLLAGQEAELELAGLWDWYPGLPAPLVVLWDAVSGQLLLALPGKYGASGRTRVRCSLPGLPAGRVRVGLSQTGELPLRGKPGNSLELRFLAAPAFSDLSPAFFDARRQAPLEVIVSGANFYQDGHASLGIRNLLCRINGLPAPLVFRSTEQVACTLTPDPNVPSYSVSLSPNFGLQWVSAGGHAVRAIVVPQIADVRPLRLASNLRTLLRLNLTASGLDAGELSAVGFSFGHVKVVSRAQLGPLSFSFLLEPLGVVLPD